MTNHRLSVVVVGGGIGGLAAANSLSRRGFDVTLLEQAPELKEVGAGVMLSPNSLRLLERWGLGAAIADVSSPIGAESFYRRADGSVVTPLVTTDSTGWNGLHGIHRADLLDLLARAIPSGVVRTGQRATSVAQDENSAVVTTDAGGRFEADVVVAADGIQSALQQFVVAPADPVDSGVVAYRGLIPIESTPNPAEAGTTSSVWMGAGKHFLTFPVRSGRLVNYVAFVPKKGLDVAESWSAEGDPDDLREAFAGWDWRVEQLLANVSSTFWWGIYDRDPLERWVSGRLALLGDAAHPMRPHMGQGANQAIEDAAALAALLDRAEPGDEVVALRDYERLRLRHTAEVQAGSRAQGKRTDSHFDDLGKRDAELIAGLEFRRSIYDYDVEREVDAKAHLNG